MSEDPEKVGDVHRQSGVRPPGIAGMGEFLEASLDRRWRRFRRVLRATQAGVSESAIHELRVSLRRLISLLEILGGAISDDATGKARRVLKKLLRTLSPVRDVHVLSGRMEDFRGRFAAAKRLAKTLKKEEEVLVRTAQKPLCAAGVGRLKRLVGRSRKALRRELLRPGGPRRTHAALMGQVREAFLKVDLRRRELTRESMDSFHALRIAFKKFRYAVEALQPGILDANDSVMRRMRQFQRRLGEIQDLALMAEFMERVAHEDDRMEIGRAHV